MHQFLSSIGFSDIRNKAQIDKLLSEIISNPMHQVSYEREDGTILCELSRDYGEFMGIAVRGEIGNDNEFIIDHFFPYFCGSGVTTDEKIELEKHSDEESYVGICEENKLGLSLIFYLQNVLEYFKETDEGKRRIRTNTTLSALSSQGMILLPIHKSEDQKERTEKHKERTSLIEAAKEGNEEAIESLTLDDIDMYSMISRRILNEDVMTIVESFFMPYGIESDQYSIMGEIQDFHYTKNSVTHEEVCILSLLCNGLTFDVCINRNNLLGEPQVGRRYKGVVWMQGAVYGVQ